MLVSRNAADDLLLARLDAVTLGAKHDYQLTEMLAGDSKKRSAVADELDRRNRYPGFYESILYDDMRSGGLDSTAAVAAAGARAALEYSKIQTKLARIDENVDELLPGEIRLRAQGKVQRSPIGTKYFMDADSGLDANAGTSTGASWKTIPKFMNNSRAAGDVGVCRMGRTATYELSGADVGPVSDGSSIAPIVLKMDYEDAWGDHADSTQTYTPVPGVKTMTASATISDISVDDWVYVTGDDSEKFSYQVKTVSGTTLTLYLPYKGDQTGAGNTIVIMGQPPVWDDENSTSRDWFLNSDHHFVVMGITLQSGANHTTGLIAVNSNAYDWIFHDTTLLMNGGSEYGLQLGSGSIAIARISKCRFYNGKRHISLSYSGCSSEKLIIEDCFIDGNSVSASNGVFTNTGASYTIRDTEIVGCTTQDIGAGIGSQVYARNLTLSGTKAVNSIAVSPAYVFIADWEGTPGDFRHYGHQANADTHTLEVERTIVRDGGSPWSIKVIPSAQMHEDGMEFGRIQILEYPVYLPASASTLEIYMRRPDSVNFTTDPTAAQLWLELEYYCHATNATVKRALSTGVVDFNGSAAWQSISVAATPAQAGAATIRLFYAKKKEVADSNIFYVDPVPVEV
jgi:hypothetical protein